MTTDAIDVRTKEGQAELRRRAVRPIPQPDDLTRPFWAGARNHELRMQRCRSCSEYQHPPRPRCILCGSDVAWAKLSGRGYVYSFVIVHHLLIPSFDKEPYAVAYVKPVETSERAYMTTNIVGCDPWDVYIGMPVQATFQVVNEVALPLFQPAAEAQLRSKGQTPPQWRGETLPRSSS